MGQRRRPYRLDGGERPILTYGHAEPVFRFKKELQFGGVHGKVKRGVRGRKSSVPGGLPVTLPDVDIGDRVPVQEANRNRAETVLKTTRMVVFFHLRRMNDGRSV